MNKKKDKCIEFENYLSEYGLKLRNETSYKNAESTIYVVCTCGEEFKIIPRTLRKIGFKKCYFCRFKNGETNLKYDLRMVKYFIENGECNSSVFISSPNYKDNDSLLNLKCACGSVFSTNFRLLKHFNNGLCPKCLKLKKSENRRIKKYDEILEYYKNTGYKLITKSSEYVDSSTHIKYICSCGSGNIINATFSQFKFGEGRVCVSCTKQFKGGRQRSYEDILEAVKKDGNCELVTSKEDYINTKQKIQFRCKCGDIFDTTFHEFGSGNKKQCNKCGIGRVTTLELLYMFDDKLKANGAKLLNYTDSDGYVLADSELTIRCKCGAIFRTRRAIFTHRDKNTCNECSGYVSKGETRVDNYLRSNNILSIREYTFQDCRGIRRPLPFDFAIFSEIGELVILIEYDGIHHFEPVNFGGRSDEKSVEDYMTTVKNDKIKNKYCYENGIKLLRIPYQDFGKIEEILREKLMETSMMEEVS